MKDYIDQNNFIILYNEKNDDFIFWIQWILERDINKKFLFMSLNSAEGNKFLSERCISINPKIPFYLWKPKTYYLMEAAAILKIGNILGGKYNLMYVGYLFPEKVCYNFIKNIFIKKTFVTLEFLKEKHSQSFIN